MKKPFFGSTVLACKTNCAALLSSGETSKFELSRAFRTMLYEPSIHVMRTEEWLAWEKDEETGLIYSGGD